MAALIHTDEHGVFCAHTLRKVADSPRSLRTLAKTVSFNVSCVWDRAPAWLRPPTDKTAPFLDERAGPLWFAPDPYDEVRKLHPTATVVVGTGLVGLLGGVL